MKTTIILINNLLITFNEIKIRMDSSDRKAQTEVTFDASLWYFSSRKNVLKNLFSINQTR